MEKKFKVPKERNPLHDHPLMRKGGRHDKVQKTKKILRKKFREEY